MRTIIDNQKGSTLVGTALAVFIYGIAAISLSHSVATEGGNSYNAYSESHALYVGQAGLEYAKRKLDQGEIADVIGKSFNNGTLTITTNPATRVVTAISSFGTATKTQTINSNFSKHCATLDVSGVVINGKDIENVIITKTCNTRVTVAKLTLSWNWHSCVTSTLPGGDISGCPVDTGGATVKNIGINSTAVYNPGNGIGSPGGGGADSGQVIDNVDYPMTTNQNYPFMGPPQGINLSQNPPSNGAYTLSIEYGDGSVGSVSFRI